MGKTVFPSVKRLKGLMREFMAAKKARKSPGFVIYLNFKDIAFTAVKRLATPVKLTRYVKRVPFIEYKRGSQWG